MLYFHIATAILTFSTAILALYRPTFQIRKIFRLFTISSVGSGILLGLTPGHFTRAFCLRLGLYLILILATELKLNAKLSHLTRVDPL